MIRCRRSILYSSGRWAMKKSCLATVVLMAALSVVLVVVTLASPREWRSIYKWEAWYGNHPEFEFTGLLRRNTRTELLVKEDGSWEYLEGQATGATGTIYHASAPDCLYLLDRGCRNQTDLYVYSPREVRRKTLLGLEEVKTYDTRSRCLRILEEYIGVNVTIRGWTREETLRTPKVTIDIRVLIPGKIKRG